jgi:hypothetical protein
MRVGHRGAAALAPAASLAAREAARAGRDDPASSMSCRDS